MSEAEKTPKKPPLFSFKNFAKAKFARRMADVLINDENSEACRVKVQQLSANEMALVKNATDYVDRKKQLIEAMEKEADVAEAVKEFLGLNEELEESLIRKLAMADFGIVEPEFEYSQLLYFAEHRPADFEVIVTKIQILTVEGAEKKP